MVAWLLGMLHVQEAAGKQAADFSPEPLPMQEAVEQLRSRVQMPASDFYRLDAAMRFRAFTVAKVSGMDAINRVKDKIEQVLQDGQTLAEFIESGREDELLQRAGFSRSTPWYWETVYRTNTISAWNAGRWAQMQRIKDSIQYIEFVAIRDPRTTEFCRVYDGVVRPVDDAIWSMITPPNHFNCRSTTRPIMKGGSEADQVTASADAHIADLPEPQQGFAASPLSPEAFARMPDSMWQRAKEYGIEEDIYKAAEKVGVSLRPAGISAPEVIIGLGVETREDMVNVIKEKLGPMSKHGIESVEFKDAKYFMATNSNGRIMISQRRKMLDDEDGFTTSEELLSAFRKLGKQDLSFKEEYALEVLWHEINHNRQLWTYRVEKEDIRNIIMETLNQWVSRRTYQEMLSQLGNFSPKWQKEIVKKGYGYPVYVNRLDMLISRLGLKDEDILGDIKKIHLEKNRLEYNGHLVELLSRKSGKKGSLIDNVFYRFDESSEEFLKSLAQL